MTSPLPVVVGLTLCRDFIRDPASGNFSVIRSFTGQPIDSFPGTGEPFCIFAILTGGIDEVEAELVITWFGEEEIVEYARVLGQISFPDPLQLVECVFRFHQFPFPGPCIYLARVLVAAQRYTEAVPKVTEAEGLYWKVGIDSGVADCFHVAAELHRGLGEIDTALDYLLKEEEIRRRFAA
jgi:hypothetical protein